MRRQGKAEGKRQMIRLLQLGKRLREIADGRGPCTGLGLWEQRWRSGNAIPWRRLRDAHLPRMKTLEEFDFT